MWSPACWGPEVQAAWVSFTLMFEDGWGRGAADTLWVQKAKVSGTCSPAGPLEVARGSTGGPPSTRWQIMRSTLVETGGGPQPGQAGREGNSHSRLSVYV